MTLYDIASTIRRYGGNVWLVQHGPFGILLRSSIGPYQLRIGVPRPGEAPRPFPEERNSTLLIPNDLPTLQHWLASFNHSKKG